jgi:phosphatidylglycerophosphate synthase
MAVPGKSSLPNLLSAARILLMPTALVAALAESKTWFVALIGVALSTDALDGFLARRLHAETDFGRKLDSAADYLTLLLGLAGIALLWPAIMHRELPWVAAGLTMFFAVIVHGFLRLGRAPCYHTWVAKVAAVACALSLVPLLAGWSPVPFHLAMMLQIAGGVEELAITRVAPRQAREVPTFWHALKLRRRAARAEAPATDPAATE